ncbi:hypothetical protein F2Q69_00042096 [Brassica cretica]|uniref:Uncharacterized protein n=1 Tax=Brassica cretica TaxID=69181 RepID=A0A8S9N4P4_BRACR|nr:hypothetical protein F2Q69_00042096 [Brassica cretica]
MEIDLRMLKMPWGCWLGIWSREQYDDLAEELVVVHEKNKSLEKGVSKMREVATGEQERARMLEHGDRSPNVEDAMGMLARNLEDGKVMKNLVAFGARKEESNESSDSDVDTNSEDYHVMLNK